MPGNLGAVQTSALGGRLAREVGCSGNRPDSGSNDTPGIAPAKIIQKHIVGEGEGAFFLF